MSLHPDSPRLDLAYEDLKALWEFTYDDCARTGTGLIVHFIGHGINGQAGNSLYLAAKNTDAGRPHRTAADIGAWLHEVENTAGGPPVLFLLDVCGAGRAPLQQWLHSLPADRRRAWVIAACAEDGKAYGARFSRATAVVLDRLRLGWLDLSPSLTHVPVETFAQEIDRELARLARAEGSPPQRVLRTAHPEADVPVPPFLRNPGFRETPAGRYQQHLENGLWQFASAVDPALDPLHFVSRASGTPHQQNVAGRCFFTGREKQLAHLKKWLEDDRARPIMVVTGSPGSGKSALLGVLACLAHPQLAEVSRTIRSVVPRHLRFDRHPLLAAVHARQRDPAAVIASIARQLGLEEAPLRGWSVETVLAQLDRRWSGTPAVIIVDALDEASLDTELLRSVLLRLAQKGVEADGPPVCKVVIGVRPWWDRFPELGARSSYPTDRVDLDRTSTAEHETDLRNYLADLLEEATGYNGPNTSGLRDGMAKAVARRLAAVPHGGGFLLASVFAHYLTEYGRPLELDEAVLRVPDDLPGMLDLHLGVLAKDRPVIQAVLRALAHGRGEGMPLEIIRAVAEALTGPGEEAPDLADTKQAIEAAAFYVRSAKDTDGRRLYRFFHQSLSDHLAPASSDHGAILDAVVATVEPAEHGDPAWDLALPYVLRHTAEHAVAAGRLDELLKSPAFLVYASPTELRAQLPYARSLRARNTARIIDSALAPQKDPWVRWEWLRNNAIGAGEKWLEHGLDALRSPDSRPPETLTLQWGSQSRETEGALSHPELAVFVQTAEGPVVVTSHAGGGVQVWDTGTGGLVNELLVGGDEVTALSAGVFDDTLLVALGTADGELTVWHLDARRIAWSASLPARVMAIAFGTLRGTPVVAVCTPLELYLYTQAGERLWDVDMFWTWFGASGDDVEHPYMLQVEHATADVVALAELDGTPTVIVGTSVGTIELWDADGGNHRSRQVHSAPVHTLLPSRRGTERTVVTCADDGVRILNMDAGTVVDVPDSAGRNQVAALLDVNGEENLALGRAGRVEVRSLRDAALPGSFVRGHACPAGMSLRALTGDGSRLLAVAESKYHGVIVLNRIDSADRLASWEGHDDGVVCVAMTGHRGRQFALSLDSSGLLHTWDTEDGLRLSTGHYPYAESATAGVVQGRPLAFVGDAQGTARAVDMTDGRVHHTWYWPVQPSQLSWTNLEGRPVLIVHDLAGRLFLADAEQPEELRPVAARQPFPPVITDTDLSDLGGEILGNPEEKDVIANMYGLHQGELVLVRGFMSGRVTGQFAADGRTAFSFVATDRLEGLHLVQHGQHLHVVTASYDGTIRVWAPFDGTEPLGQIQVPGEGGPLAVSPTGVLAASGPRIYYFSWASTGEEIE